MHEFPTPQALQDVGEDWTACRPAPLLPEEDACYFSSASANALGRAMEGCIA